MTQSLSALSRRKPGIGFTTRMRNALPSPAVALGGGCLWALAMGASALSGLIFDGWQAPGKIRFVTGIFVAGGFTAFPLGLFAARLFSSGRRAEAAFAAAFVCLLTATIGATGLIFGLQYRVYYSEWHAGTLSKMWLNEFVFTILAALYQFAVLGIRLYFPLGIAALVLASLWFARLRR